MEQSLVADLPNAIISEAINQYVKVECNTGCVYSGQLVRFDEKSANIELKNVTCQEKDLSLTILERVLLRGVIVRLIHLPAIMRRAPLLQWSNSEVQTALRKSLKKKRRNVKAVKEISVSMRKEYKERRRIQKLR